MREYNEYSMFSKPKKPFLLIYSKTFEESCEWFDTEEELLQEINEVTYYGFKIDCAIEIGSFREIKFEDNREGAKWKPKL